MRSDVGVTVRAAAPVRLDFAGGWTDVAPFAEREGGAVVNAAIGLRASAEVRCGGTAWRLCAEDLEEELVLSTDGLHAGAGLPLLRAASRRSGLPPSTIITRSEVPPGSGLGSSGALGVALVAATDAAAGRRQRAEDLAEEAWRLEAVDADLAGGRQDQYAAALGGWHLFRFRGARVESQRLRLDPAFEDSLAGRVIVGYTGGSRVSSHTIARVMGRYRAGDPEVVDALRQLTRLADEMAEALRSADLGRTAALLSDNWRQQQRLDPGMRTEAMARLEQAMQAAGALGGKAAGAGAGGCMFFVAGSDRAAAEAAVRGAGAQVIPFTWSATGVEVG